MLPEKQHSPLDGNTFVVKDKFLRRIPPWHLKSSGEISSAAFENDKGKNSFSTNWLKLSSIDDTLKSFPEYGVAAISAELCWNLGQNIEWTPTDDNVAHTDILGKKTESTRKKIRNGAEYLIFPQKIDI